MHETRPPRALLRYPAFPHQRFGHHRGTVRQVSRSALAQASSSMTGAGGSGEPFIGSVSSSKRSRSWPMASPNLCALGCWWRRISWAKVENCMNGCWSRFIRCMVLFLAVHRFWRRGCHPDLRRFRGREIGQILRNNRVLPRGCHPDLRLSAPPTANQSDRAGRTDSTI